MSSAVRDWAPQSFRACGLQFEPQIIQRDTGEDLSYEVVCCVYRDDENRIHRASASVESVDGIEQQLELTVQQTVEATCVARGLEDDIEDALLAAATDIEASNISRAMLGEVRLHDKDHGYTIHVDAEAVKRPDGFNFAVSGWLGSDDTDTIIANIDESTYNSINALSDGIRRTYENLRSKRASRIDEAEAVREAIQSFEPPDID